MDELKYIAFHAHWKSKNNHHEESINIGATERFISISSSILHRELSSSRKKKGFNQTKTNLVQLQHDRSFKLIFISAN